MRPILWGEPRRQLAGAVLSRSISSGSGTWTERATPPSSRAVGSRAEIRPKTTGSRESAVRNARHGRRAHPPGRGRPRHRRTRRRHGRNRRAGRGPSVHVCAGGHRRPRPGHPDRAADRPHLDGARARRTDHRRRRPDSVAPRRAGRTARRRLRSRRPGRAAGHRRDRAGLRFAWQGPAGAVRHCTLHRAPARRQPALPRRDLSARLLHTGPGAEQGERAARFEVRVVGELYTASTPATAVHRW